LLDARRVFHNSLFGGCSFDTKRRGQLSVEKKPSNYFLWGKHKRSFCAAPKITPPLEKFLLRPNMIFNPPSGGTPGRENPPGIRGRKKNFSPIKKGRQTVRKTLGGVQKGGTLRGKQGIGQIKPH